MNTPVNALQLLLPQEIFEHFELIDSQTKDNAIHLFLDEKPIPPLNGRYYSKGFTEQSVINDFPIRGKSVLLHVRRRKWLNLHTGEVVTSSYVLTHLGTQITKEFADFLKGIHRK
jgi:hypothetical protein